jgi:methyl-accepting chemotaxis protein
MVMSFFGRLIVKIGFILSLMTAATVMTIYTSDGMFRQASMSMETLGTTRVPELLQNTDALAATSALQQGLAALQIAPTPAAVTEARDRALSVLQDMQVVAHDATEAERIQTIRGLIADLADARTANFAGTAAVAEAVNDLSTRIDSISAMLAEAEDKAAFDLTVNGENAITAVGTTLDTLIEKDFQSLRMALEVRSAVNDLAGMTLAHGQTGDASLRAMLLDLVNSARGGIEFVLPELAERPELAALEPAVAAFLDAAKPASGLRLGASEVASILAARAEVERMAVTAIDEIEFNLFLNATSSRDQNETTIRTLIDVQVANIREGARLASLVRQTVILGLQSLVSSTPAQIATLTDAITPMLGALTEASASVSDAALAAELAALVALLDPDSGVPALRLRGLAATERASVIATEAAAATGAIGQSVSRRLEGTLDAVSQSSQDLLVELRAVEELIWSLAGGSAVILLFAILITWLTIVRPLGRVTRLTERLAAGDLAPITGMDRVRGEIGRMVTALKVFRDGMSERALLEAERRRAEEEAARRAHDQERVVETLASAFARLSEGDLGVAIGSDFPDDYAALRKDFNLAIDRLATLLGAAADLGARIRASSQEISGTSQDLSQRTEIAASTLQTTVSDLAGLALSVQKSAEGVSDAAKLGSRARQDAEQSVTVIRKSLELMASINDAFKRISAVIGLIDDIAFQTNLLALNAGVEAARAGDAGRGFAVVASEVRALAQRSSDAARDIKQLIAESDSLVAVGVKSTGQAGQSLSGIVEAVIAMADRIEQIAASSVSQSATIADVSHAAGALDQSMQYNVARFEETTAASKILSEEASILATRLQDFRLPSGDAAPGAVLPLAAPRGAKRPGRMVA